MKFLAGVGVAQIFDGERLVASANALIDSSISISVSTEDLRAGTGAKLFGRYMHSSGMTLKLTDAMFNLEYIAMNTGSDVTLGGDVMKSEKLTAVAGKLTLSATPKPFFNGATKVYVLKDGGAGSYQAYPVAGNVVDLGNASDNGKYCVRYMANDAYASRILINSNFIPKTLSVILTANLYEAGSCGAATVDNASLAGSLQIKVFRFQLNGNQELSMTATGISNTSIEGTALNYGCNGCNDEGVYAEILEFKKNASDDMFASIIVEDATREASKGDKLPIVVYACPVDGAPIKLANNQFEVAASGTGYTYADGIVTIANEATSPVEVGVEAFGKSTKLTVTIK